MKTLKLGSKLYSQLEAPLNDHNQSTKIYIMQAENNNEFSIPRNSVDYS